MSGLKLNVVELRDVRSGRYYIIEHSRRGTLAWWDYDDNEGFKFHFSWSGMRTDPEKAYQFPILRSARLWFDRLPEKLRAECKIRRSPDFVEVYPDDSTKT